MCCTTSTREAKKKMESVALSNVQLDYLARQDPCLKPYYRGALPCDGLPTNASHQQSAYIVNTDEKRQPGKHWIALWTRDNVCEVMDSYGLPVEIYEAKPLEIWLKRWQQLWPTDKVSRMWTVTVVAIMLCFFSKPKPEVIACQTF